MRKALVLTSAALACVLSGGARADAPPGNLVQVIRVNGVINAGTARYIARGIERAKDQKAELLMVVLNTPGGLLNSTREIVQAINQSEVPVAVYVAPGGASATSAGTIITMSAHFAGMAPGTNIGAAHPVGIQGEDAKGAMMDKAVNDTAAFIKAQAALRERNTEWAESAIRKSVSATSDEALKLKVVDFIAAELHEALLKVDGLPPRGIPKARPVKVAGLPVVELEMTLAERFLAFLGDPNVSYLLMVLGGLGIYVEITTPGAVLPGVLGAISIILAFVSFSTLPINYGAVALLALGMVLFLLEAFITSYGVLTVGGIISLLIGALLLMDPSTGDLRLSLALVLPTVAAVSLIAGFFAYAMFKSRSIVYTGLTNFTEYEGTVQGVDGEGRAGKCLIRGEVWDFELDPESPPVRAGDHVRVTRRDKFKLVCQRRS